VRGEICVWQISLFIHTPVVGWSRRARGASRASQRGGVLQRSCVLVAPELKMKETIRVAVVVSFAVVLSMIGKHALAAPPANHTAGLAVTWISS